MCDWMPTWTQTAISVLSPSVNFKEPEAVRALTCTLLKEDFGLTIQIPLERLIPTVPLRLNYIHWVEDLVDGQKQPRRGIDIGTITTFPFFLTRVDEDAPNAGISCSAEFGLTNSHCNQYKEG